MEPSPTQADAAEGPNSDSRVDSASVITSLSARLRAPLRRFFTKRRIPKDDVDDLVQDVFEPAYIFNIRGWRGRVFVDGYTVGRR